VSGRQEDAPLPTDHGPSLDVAGVMAADAWARNQTASMLGDMG